MVLKSGVQEPVVASPDVKDRQVEKEIASPTMKKASKRKKKEIDEPLSPSAEDQSPMPTDKES